MLASNSVSSHEQDDYTKNYPRNARSHNVQELRPYHPSITYPNKFYQNHY